MNRIVECLCELLDRDERDAVCGDLIEARAATARALIDVGGLVLRRQAGLWLGWRPWFALVTIVIPIGFLLSVSSRWFADSAASHFWLYVRTGSWSYFAVPGWRRDVIAGTLVAAGSFLALAGWSWVTGFVLGRISRRTWWTLAMVFGAIVVAATLPSTTTGIMGYPEAHFRPVGLLFTAVVRVALVLWPAWLGLARGRDHAALRVSGIAIALTVAVLTLWMAKFLEGSLVFGWGLALPQPGPDGLIGTADDLRPLWWVSLVMCWPALFLVLESVWRTELTTGTASRP